MNLFCAKNCWNPCIVSFIIYILYGYIKNHLYAWISSFLIVNVTFICLFIYLKSSDGECETVYIFFPFTDSFPKWQCQRRGWAWPKLELGIPFRSPRSSVAEAHVFRSSSTAFPVLDQKPSSRDSISTPIGDAHNSNTSLTHRTTLPVPKTSIFASIFHKIF